MTPQEFLNEKHVLVMGLGVFGGGQWAAKWLFANGAKVTVTDLHDEKALRKALTGFTRREREGIEWTLGEHHESDILKSDMIVVNPGVPNTSPFLKLARKKKKALENVASLFFRFVENPTVAVTGTRGKSTTTSFIAQLLSSRHDRIEPIGSVTRPLLKALPELSKDPTTPAVIELSSWQTELLPKARRGPHIAIITNLFSDHLNRYKNIEAYADAKAGIFAHQGKNDFLILDHDDPWTIYFLAKRPKARVLFFSTRPLPKGKHGIFIRGGSVIFRLGTKGETVVSVERFAKKFGDHNVKNLLPAILSARLIEPDLKITERSIGSLATIPYRQEVIYRKPGLLVVNDTTATSPDGVLAALDRFSSQGRIVLIAGGTDKELDLTSLAKRLSKQVSPEDLILLEGSATRKLVEALEDVGYFSDHEASMHNDLPACVSAALLRARAKKGKTVVLFSPGAASFEKFQNEYDRGEQFSALIERQCAPTSTPKKKPKKKKKTRR